VADLTQPLVDGTPTLPGDPPVCVRRVADVASDGFSLHAIELHGHAGTHVDAPAHTEPDGRTLDAFEPAHFVRRARLVDCRDRGPREPIPPDRVPEARDGLDCAVFRTGWDEHWGTDRYLAHPYLAPETARRCADRGLAVGIDTFGPDPTPPPDGDAGGLPAHHALLGAGLVLVENLTGLGAVPATFELRAYPLALAGDGAPTRAVGVEV
jgi:kynurenine formamidase